jgi:hypothetical protein
VSLGVIGTDDLDLDISIAHIALGAARGVWQRCPTADNQARVDAALAEVDRLLDQRLAVTD